MKNEEVTRALKLQADNRARARARNAALVRLKQMYPEDYQRLYQEEREKQKKEE